MSQEVSDVDTIHKTNEIIRIMHSAVRKAQAESRRLGVPNVYSINGILHYELPSGELTTTPPTPKAPSESHPIDGETV